MYLNTIKFMKIHAILWLLISITFGCKQKADTKTVLPEAKDSIVLSHAETKNTGNNQQPYFQATGTEPFWSLGIYSNLVVFQTPTDTLKTPHAEPILAMDANVKRYNLNTEALHIKIQIVQKECTNQMSGKVSPYEVVLQIKQTFNKDFETLKGCGAYVTDYRLHDIWVLETLKGKKVTKDDFSQEFPTIEINSSKNTVMGFAGCNQINGKLFFEKGLLRFKNIVTTEKMCEPSNKEPEFLKALQSSVGYTVENNRLTLYNPTETLIVFRKTD